MKVEQKSRRSKADVDEVEDAKASDNGVTCLWAVSDYLTPMYAVNHHVVFWLGTLQALLYDYVPRYSLSGAH